MYIELSHGIHGPGKRLQCIVLLSAATSGDIVSNLWGVNIRNSDINAFCFIPRFLKHTVCRQISPSYWFILVIAIPFDLVPLEDLKNETMTTTTSPEPFTEINPVEASSLPRPGSPAFQAHIDELVAAATKLIESTPKWKSRGHYHHIVEVRERMDWRGKRNWFLRRSVHKDVSFETFKVNLYSMGLTIERAIRKSYEE